MAVMTTKAEFYVYIESIKAHFIRNNHFSILRQNIRSINNNFGVFLLYLKAFIVMPDIFLNEEWMRLQ